MKKLILLIIMAALFFIQGEPFGLPVRSALAQSDTRPNIIVIMTDDQDDMGSMSIMTKTKSLLADKGVTFKNSFVDNAVCCPSRATFITGQYSHNHSILDIEPPLGGYGKLHPTAQNTLPVWLQQSGYHTALIGKYLNGYGTEIPGTTVPPGWHFWNGLVDKSTYKYYNYTISENGTLHTYGNSLADYQTDVLAKKAADYISSRTDSSQPFFLWLTPMAPHIPISNGSPTPRYEGLFSSLALPQAPSFNESDVSDKPSFIQSRPLMSGATIDSIQTDFRLQRERLLAVDDMVKTVIDILEASGKLDNTVIIFTSDNGFFNGEHRLPTNKRLVYEESIRVPLVIRGPGIPNGETRTSLVSNVDLPATIIDFAKNVTPGRALDGKSLIPLLQNPSTPWRTTILLQGLDRFPPANTPLLGTYQAVRTNSYKYAEHATVNGIEKEFYDLKNDPYELTSAHNNPRYASVISSLQSTLTGLKSCAGTTCLVTIAEPSLPLPPSKSGDLNSDGKVDIFDYNLLIADFGKSGSLPADLDANGKVDIFDYNILVGSFGK